MYIWYENRKPSSALQALKEQQSGLRTPASQDDAICASRCHMLQAWPWPDIPLRPTV